MEKKILKIITIVLTSALIVTNTITACGWYEHPDGYRISLFRPGIAELYGYQAFYYTPDFLNGYLPAFNNNDRTRNCEEWQSLLNSSIKINDIFTILYKVEPDMLILAYDDHKLNETFEGNTFIEQLLLEKNKKWLDYLIFAKKNEFNNQYIYDPWSENWFYDEIGKISAELISIAEEQLKKIKDQRLKERYAYHLIRLYRQTDQNEACIKAFDTYFSTQDNNSVLKNWSLLHKAEALYALGNKAEANYLYSVVFNSSEEKRIRAFKLFEKDLMEQSLKYAKNPNEAAGIWAIMALKNPGPAFQQIKMVIENNPQHKALPLIIMREVNKLEDWIFTPQLTSHLASIEEVDYYTEWDQKYEQIKKENRQKDLQYLAEFNKYLQEISNKTSPELADYLKLARAHLSLMAEQNSLALELFNAISPNASKAIQIQKNTELALYYAFENELLNNDVKEKLAGTLNELDHLSAGSKDARKQMQSLCEILSKVYLKNKDVVSAGLLKLKAETYKDAYEEASDDIWTTYVSDWHKEDFYWKIAFFDRYAGLDDIDKLIELLEKKKKSRFEIFLLKNVTLSKNAFLDLKGTIALRLGDLQTASATFSAMPHDFWEKTYEFKTYLNENPFHVPNTEREASKYQFNKADLLKELVSLENEAKTNKAKAAENYIKLGNFYYNASYWGNSWMMLSYSYTSAPKYGSTTFGYHDVLFGDILKDAEDYESSYYKCEPALNYYLKAEKSTSDKEQLAMIFFMKHCCSYNRFIWQEMKRNGNDKEGKFKPEFITDLYTKYSNTETFRQIRCPLLDDFAWSLGILN